MKSLTQHLRPAPAIALAFALVLALPAIGGSINVDFSRDPSSPLGGASPVLHNAAGPAPDSGTVWNDYKILIPDTNGNSVTTDDVIATPYLANDLVDSSGAATTVDVELTSGWFRAFNGTPVNTLQKEWLFARSATGILTVKGLDPLLTYDFHLIGSGNYDTNYTIGGITKSVTGIYSQSDVSLWTQGTQYAVFTAIAPDAGGNVSISVVANSGADGAIAAMQISPSDTPDGDFFYADAVASTGGVFNSSYMPENLFNDGFTSPTDTIDTTTTYTAAGNNYASASGTIDNFDLVFEFSGPAEVNGMHVWNYTYRTSTGGGATGPASGVNAYTLTFYDGPGGSGSAIGSVYNGSLAQAPFNALSTAQSIYFPAAYQNVRSVVMRVISNHGSAAFTGLNELAFNGTASSSAITSFTASASFVQRPALPTLSWEIEGDITSLEITPDVGDVTGNTIDGIGSIEVAPIGDQTYTLILNGSIEQAVNVVGLPTKEKLHIYLLIGQSNMQGEGNDGKNNNLDAPHPRVVKFGSRSDSSLVDFVTGGHRLTSYDSVAGSNIGMGVEFGKTLIAAVNDPEVVVCLINHAVGGTAIEWWEPGVVDPSTPIPQPASPTCSMTKRSPAPWPPRPTEPSRAFSGTKGNTTSTTARSPRDIRRASRHWLTISGTTSTARACHSSAENLFPHTTSPTTAPRSKPPSPIFPGSAPIQSALITMDSRATRPIQSTSTLPRSASSVNVMRLPSSDSIPTPTCFTWVDF
jgi:hypothetical protein